VHGWLGGAVLRVQHARSVRKTEQCCKRGLQGVSLLTLNDGTGTQWDGLPHCADSIH